MLIRVRGGVAGIKEYLETGRKDGRDHARVELDERVVLAGDLEQLDQVLGIVRTKGDRYLHVTLSFKEDDVPEETLREIAEDFRKFAFAAYREDEYVFYAEAHVPRLKGYVDQRSGDAVERKPHIHVVIPNWNLLANKLMQPFGRVELQTDVLAAFQEHVNAKYGLASPQDNRRVLFTGESTMIERYKGDLFNGQGQNVRQTVLNLILDRDVRDVDTLKALLEKSVGEVREGNAGRSDAYLMVKSAEAARFTRLKDHVFSPAFLEIPIEEKRARLQSDIAQRYEEAGPARQTPEVIAAKLAEWDTTRGAEIKYLHSGHKGYAAYWQAPESEQRQLLASLRERFYQRHDKEYENARDERSDSRGALAAAQGDLRAAARNLDAVKRDPRGLDQAERFEADRRARGLIKAALARLGRDQTQTAGDERTVTLGDSKEGRVIDSEIGQLEARARRAGGQGKDIDRIKSSLDASHLLAYVARSHGVRVDKYGVSKARDGSDRIVCGRRHLNVSDFLTQEMRMPWKDAAALLREIDRSEQEPAQRSAGRRQSLWAHFVAEWRPIHRQLRQNDFEKQHTTGRQRSDLGRRQYQAKRRSIQNSTDLKPSQRRAALSLARMEKVASDLALRKRAEEERKALKTAYQLKPADEFRTYLADRASRGDVEALHELRRQRLPEPLPANAGIRAATKSAAAADVLVPASTLTGAALHYEVNRRGHVTYKDSARASLFTDTGRAVDFAKRDRATRELGLRLAVEKFGFKLALYGTDSYKREMAQIAAESGLRVTFVEPAVQTHFEAIKAQQAAAKTIGLEKDTKPPAGPLDFVAMYVSERQEHQRKVLSSPETYRPWESSHAGAFAYDGWRTLKDGSKAILLRQGETIFVKAATEALVQELKQLPRGRELAVTSSGSVKAVDREQGMER